MRRDEVLLIDILVAARRIREHLSNLSREDFLSNKMASDAVERQILTLGEAVSRLSESFRQTHPEVPWDRMVNIRNFYVHAYERVDPDGVWTTARGIIRRVEREVAKLVPDEDAI